MSTLSVALDAQRRGAFNRALEAFSRVLSRDPENGIAHAHLSLCLHQMGRPIGALEEATRALTYAPNIALAHAAQAVALLGLDDVTGARRATAEARRLDPENTDALVVSCMIELQDRDRKALRDAAEALLLADPTSEEGHFFASRAASLALDGHRAEAHAREALRLNPEAAGHHVVMGWAFWAQRRFDAARDAGLSALAIDPNNAGAHSLLAAVEMHRRPLTGRFHRLGMILDTASIQQMVLYVLPVGFLYLCAGDVLTHYERTDLNLYLNFGLLACLFGWHVSRQAYRKAAAANLQAAELKTDY